MRREKSKGLRKVKLFLNMKFNRIQLSANYILLGNSQVTVLCSSANNSDKMRDII